MDSELYKRSVVSQARYNNNIKLTLSCCSLGQRRRGCVSVYGEEERDTQRRPFELQEAGGEEEEDEPV